MSEFITIMWENAQACLFGDKSPPSLGVSSYLGNRDGNSCPASEDCCDQDITHPSIHSLIRSLVIEY